MHTKIKSPTAFTIPKPQKTYDLEEIPSEKHSTFMKIKAIISTSFTT